MKPYQKIQKANTVISAMKRDLYNSNNEKRDVERINTLIDALESFDDILVSNYKVNEIDKLLCYILSDFIMRYESEGGYADLDLHQIIGKIDTNIDFSSNYHIRDLANQIRGYEVSKSAFNYDYDSLMKVPQASEIEILIKKLLLEFKKEMIWSKR
jgi:hypothetical protein|tara:strand:+ start:112 stop:579 length:468 start_codon:yes stop_codon:yes gene_type:complete